MWLIVRAKIRFKHRSWLCGRSASGPCVVNKRKQLWNIVFGVKRIIWNVALCKYLVFPSDNTQIVYIFLCRFILYCFFVGSCCKSIYLVFFWKDCSENGDKVLRCWNKRCLGLWDLAESKFFCSSNNNLQPVALKAKTAFNLLNNTIALCNFKK